MGALTLVGTVHLDPGGSKRLLRLLDAAAADTVTVEVSRFALSFRRDKGPGLLSRLTPFRRPDGKLPGGLASVARQLEIPFEYAAACAYGKRTGARVHAIGSDERSEELLGLLEREVFAGDNLRVLSRLDTLPLSVQVSRQWAKARHELATGFRRADGGLRRRDDVEGELARRIRSHAVDSDTVHVGGWEHLKGLAVLLDDLEPEVRLLDPGEPRQG